MHHTVHGTSRDGRCTKLYKLVSNRFIAAYVAYVFAQPSYFRESAEVNSGKRALARARARFHFPRVRTGFGIY